MEPTPRLELGTCRLRNEYFGSISLILNGRRSACFGVIRGSFRPNLHHNLQRFLWSEYEEELLDAADRLGIALVTLQGHVKKQTFEPPPLAKVGGVSVRLWTDVDIKRARKALAGVRPGRRPKG